MAALELGWTVDAWEILPVARETRREAGLGTLGKDVLECPALPGMYDVEISSPPCQTFSIAGYGKGRQDLQHVLDGVAMYGQGVAPSEVRSRMSQATSDPRTALVLEPLRLALAGGAPYLAWEQVPTVLPVWKACAAVLRERGYSVATGVLHAQRYGVPQRRKRAVLMARSDGKVAQLPGPTVEREITMAEALEWGFTDRASMSVTAGGTGSGGGVELFGNGARRAMREAYEAGPAAWAGGGEMWSAGGKSLRVSTADVLRLQGFPADYPVQGRIGQRTLQVGNAVPPPMAKAILATLVA